MEAHVLVLLSVTGFCLLLGLVGGLFGRAERLLRLARQMDDARGGGGPRGTAT